MEYREFTKEEISWAKELQKVINKAPSTLFLFMSGGLKVIPLDENNDRYVVSGGSMDANAPMIHILNKNNMDMDGGDW